MGTVNEVPDIAVLADEQYDEPFATATDCAVVKLHGSDAKIKKQTLWWATSHTDDKEFESKGRTQYPLQKNNGKEQVDQFLQGLDLKFIVDVSGVSKAWAEASWHVAFHSAMLSFTFAPNQAALVRFMYSGAIDLIMIDFVGLLVALVKRSQKTGEKRNIEEGSDLSLAKVLDRVGS